MRISDWSSDVCSSDLLGVIPAAMPSLSFLTDRFCAANPASTIEIRSLSSRAIAQGLDAFELDGGLTYLENEPIAHVRRVPLYHERYKLIVPRGHALRSEERRVGKEGGSRGRTG